MQDNYIDISVQSEIHSILGLLLIDLDIKIKEKHPTIFITENRYTDHFNSKCLFPCQIQGGMGNHFTH